MRLREEKLDRKRCARLLKRPLEALAGRWAWCWSVSAAAVRRAGDGTCIDIGRMRGLCGVIGAAVELFAVAGLVGGGSIVLPGASLCGPALP